MPRQARKKSESGIYHIMLRGINQQQIFEDEEDYEKFIQILRECKAVSKYELYGTQGTVLCAIRNTVEYVDGAYTYITKPTETTRDSETRITGSKTEICSGTSEVDVLKAADAFGRTQQTTMILRSTEENEENEEASFAAVVTDYSYKTRNSSTAAGQVDALQARVTYGSSMAAENTVKSYDFAYDYDANGNITYEYAIGENGVRTVRYHYTYDEANQLTRVDDNVRGKTYVYQYDKGGNRVSEKIYNYTLSDTLGTEQKEIKSAYTYPLWDDRLSSYDGKTITYDVAGNPTQYGDTTYVWEGKQLVEIQPGDGTKTQFEYDANGFRTQKRQYQEDGTLLYRVDYVWLNGKLVQQTMIYRLRITVQGSDRYVNLPFNTKFIYNDSDQPLGCIVNGEASYMFIRNLQGDIIALADAEGTILVEYSYDAWGNVQVSYPNGNEGDEEDEQLKQFTAIFCPLTYRGYNYDFTTGLYYLQSRYYNPEWGRFMNVDDTSILLATQGETHNANLFAYCENNPVNMVDYTGQSSTDPTLQLIFIYAIIPTIFMLQRLQETKHDYILNDYESLFVSIESDPSGVLIYRFRYIVYQYNSGLDRQEDWYEFELYYGSYNNWKTFIDTKVKTAKVSSKIAETITPSIIDPFITPLKFVTFVTMEPLNLYLKQKSKFLSNSQNVIEALKYAPNKENRFFGALGIIMWNSIEYRTGKLSQKKIYKGDNTIYEIF